MNKKHPYFLALSVLAVAMVTPVIHSVNRHTSITVAEGSPLPVPRPPVA